MPEMTGWDFLDNYNSENVYTKIYILSSSVDERDMSKANSYPTVKDYLSKPLIKSYVELIFS
jgi:YesN/AraC family two-component response regulator